MQRSLLLILAGVAGACDGQGKSQKAPELDARPPAPSSSASAAALPPLLPDGCWAGVGFDQATPELFAAVVARCLQGFEPLLGARSDVELGAGAARELSFELGRPRCVRIVAAADPSVVDLEVSLAAANGAPLGRDDLSARFALVSARGPVCLHPGAYRVTLRAPRGSGRAIMGVYAAR